MTLRVYVGSYTGNGTDNTWITGINDNGTLFTPQAAFVFGLGSNLQNGAIKLGRPNQDTSASWGGQFAGSLINEIQQFALGSMQVGNGVRVNANGSIYHFFALDGTGSDIQIGSWTSIGIGQGNMHVPTSFAPGMVITTPGSPWGTSTALPLWRTSSVPTGDTKSFFFRALAPLDVNGIRTLSGSGFEVGSGTDTASVGSGYLFLAIAPSRELKVGSYVGSGIDNVTIPHNKGNCQFVNITREGVALVTNTARFSTEVGDNAIGLANSTPAETTNQIQLFVDGGFQIGTSTAVNQPGSVYHYFAFGSLEAAPPAIRTGLIAYYPMDRQLGSDIIGSNHAILLSGPPKQVNGKIGSCYNFTDQGGNGSFLSFGDNSNFEFGSADFTISAWVNLKSFTDTHTIMSKYTTAGSGREFQYTIPNGSLLSLLTSSDGITSTSSTSQVLGSFIVNTWYHVVVTRSGANVTHYVNGSPFSYLTNANTTIVGGKAGAAYIGAVVNSVTTPDNELAGSIDEVGVWRVALTSEQIGSLYNNGLGSSFVNYYSATILSNSMILGTGSLQVRSDGMVTGSVSLNIPSNATLTGSEHLIITSNSDIFGTVTLTLPSNSYIFDGNIPEKPRIHINMYVPQLHTQSNGPRITGIR